VAGVHDPDRLDVIRNLGLEMSADRALFSRITMLASTMLGCPIALLSIVEDARQCFLGCTGIDLHETPRDVSFCAVCITGEGALLVPDARADLRFGDNALVTGAPFIRSYLGVLIRGEGGVLLGALCAISPEPRALCSDQIGRLAMLAELAEQSIALHVRTRELSFANAALKQTSQIFRQAERATNVGSWRVDLASQRLYWSDQVYAITGLEPRRSVSVEQAVTLYQTEDQAMVSKALEETVAHRKPFAFETSIRRGDGERRRIRVMGERIDIEGRPDSVAGIIHDCTEEHLRNAALKRAAEHDRLTGLFNRASFDRKLAAAMRSADSDPVMVALIDLNGFKDVNDTLGHLVGDRVLVAIAEHLHQRIRRGMFLARWGGDEFALLFPPAIALEAASGFLHDLVAELDDVIALGSSALTIGATCGLARMEQPGTGEEIMRRRRSGALSRQGSGMRRGGVLGRADRGQADRTPARHRPPACGTERRTRGGRLSADRRAGDRPDHLVRGAAAPQGRGRQPDHRQRDLFRAARSRAFAPRLACDARSGGGRWPRDPCAAGA
jgi:diguanylate cyclase (GGDEF)-like protein/PAS domain S-box-containing protein